MLNTRTGVPNKILMLEARRRIYRLNNIGNEPSTAEYKEFPRVCLLSGTLPRYKLYNRKTHLRNGDKFFLEMITRKITDPDVYYCIILLHVTYFYFLLNVSHAA